MRAPGGTCFYLNTSHIAKCTLLIATLLVKTCAATLPTPPSSADQWLYPNVNTVPTYNYLDTVNASWTSNFVAPYLLLRCQPPGDTTQYAFPYNHSVSATGSILVPLDDGKAWMCHFEVSDLSTSSATPPTFISNNFNVVLNKGQTPVLWTNSQDGGGTTASSATSNPTTASRTSSEINTSKISTSSVTTPQNTLSSAASTPTTAPASLSSTTPSSSTNIPTPTQASPSPTPSSPPSGLSKSHKIAIIVGATMGALLLLIIAIAVLFILRTRRSERNATVVYRSGPGDGYESREVSGFEAPRERWKGVEIPKGPAQNYF